MKSLPGASKQTGTSQRIVQKYRLKPGLKWSYSKTSIE
jgi:hypothetical protein